MPTKSLGGRPKKPDREKMSLYFPVELAQGIREIGSARRMAYSALVEEYIADGIAKDAMHLREPTKKRIAGQAGKLLGKR